MGSDGVSPVELQILIGTGSREHFQAHYFNTCIRPIGKMSTVIPESPQSDDALLDACIAFYPSYFGDCPAMSEVAKEPNVAA